MKHKRIALIITAFIAICGLNAFTTYRLLSRPSTHVATSVSTPQVKHATIRKPYVLPKIVVADIYAGVNAERAVYGLTALNIDARLEASACAKASDMETRGYWAHDAPDGTTPWHFFTEAGYNSLHMGENLGKGYKKASDMVNGWINSPSHEENIVGNYTDMGVCTIQAKNYDGLKLMNLVVNHFGS